MDQNNQNTSIQNTKNEKRVSKKSLRVLALAFALCMMMSFACASETTSTVSMDTFLGYGTSLLEWILSSLGSLINTVMQYPMLAFGAILSIVFTVLIFYRKVKRS